MSAPKQRPAWQTILISLVLTTALVAIAYYTWKYANMGARQYARGTLLTDLRFFVGLLAVFGESVEGLGDALHDLDEAGGALLLLVEVGLDAPDELEDFLVVLLELGDEFLLGLLSGEAFLVGGVGVEVDGGVARRLGGLRVVLVVDVAEFDRDGLLRREVRGERRDGRAEPGVVWGHGGLGREVLELVEAHGGLELLEDAHVVFSVANGFGAQ